MEIPNYKKSDLNLELREGGNYLNLFATFFKKLASYDDTDYKLHKAQIGILAIVNERGTFDLSEAQLDKLQMVVDYYANRKCRKGGCDIPLSEVLDLEESDGLCSYHWHYAQKEEDEAIFLDPYDRV